MPLRAAMDAVLKQREPEYVDSLFAKLNQEGIEDAKDLLVVSRAAMEMKLAKHSNFMFRESKKNWFCFQNIC